MCTIDMAQMFDIFDGGGLDITFVGALEIDREGNVNVHHTPGKIDGGPGTDRSQRGYRSAKRHTVLYNFSG